MIDLIMLATLFDGPRHGYQLKREAGFIFGQDNLHNNLVYPLLRRFTGEGWVTKKSLPGQRGQTRQQYAITPLGRKTLTERLAAFTEQDARSFEAFILRVGMFDLLQPPVRERILNSREGRLRQQAGHLNLLKEKLDLGAYGGEVVGQLSRRIQSELNWVRRLRRSSKSKQGVKP